MSKDKSEKKEKWVHIKKVGRTFAGVIRLAFIVGDGIGAYVLWFSSDSLTLKVVAGILTVHAACQAIALSTKE